MTKKDFIKVTTYAAVFGIVGGMTFEGVNFAADKLIGNSSVEQSADSEKEEDSQNKKADATTISSSSGNSSGVSDVAESVLPSIVAIDVTIQSNVNDVFGRTYEQNQSGSGSGIIVSQDNKNIYIVTNNHVVSDASKVSVTFFDESVCSATVKGTDSDSDLAVVQVPISELPENAMDHLKVAELGDSDDIKVGEQAIAIGNALGYGTSVTVGYISAKEREVASEDVTMKLLQTDAAINPGNSGGALVDSEGKVIGINSAKYADEQVEGMGFAIPITDAVSIINEMIEAQQVSKEEQAYLGIKGSDVTKEYAQYYNIPEGIYVGEVSDDSPAKSAGMLTGDIIVQFNDKETTAMESLQERLGRCKAGENIKIVVKRLENGEYKKNTLNITLGNKKDVQNTETPDSNPGNEIFGNSN